MHPSNVEQPMGFKTVEDRREYHRQYRAKLKAAGRCRCGYEKLQGFSQCGACVSCNRHSTNERNAKRRKAGQCRHCGKPPEPGKSKCASCAAVGKAWIARQKARVVAAYGGKCECCGEMEPTFLTIDHVNNDGAIHRKHLGRKIYKYLEQEGYPKDNFRLLCWNCNAGRHINGGVCPHQVVA